MQRDVISAEIGALIVEVDGESLEIEENKHIFS
jgi:hypothetical protein